MCMRNWIVALSLAGAGFAMAAGCETMNTTERAKPIGQRVMVDDKRIVTDVELNKKVRIVGVNESRTPDGLLQIQVEVVNLTSQSHPFHYLFEWFDGQGMIVTTGTPSFKQTQIIGGESMMLVGVAPRPSVTDFRLKLIED